MYGYVVPIKAELSEADFCLYRAVYCGMCKNTGKLYGQWQRLTTNYDMVFLSVLLFDYLKADVQFNNERCICNPKKKTVVCSSELFDKIAALNILLSYCKARDDVLDGGGVKKKLACRMLKKSYKKAAALLPEADKIIGEEYERLRAYEAENAAGVDRVADCFASMLSRLGALFVPDGDEKFFKLLYNVGKFTYLADALDDVTEDFKHKRYNPLIAEYGNFQSRKQFIEDNRAALTFLFASTVNRVIECFNGLQFTGAHDLLKNIVYFGMRGKCDELIKSEKKLPPPKI